MKREGDTWVISEYEGSDISISSFGQPWMVSWDNKLQYYLSGENVITDIADIERVAIGLDDVFLVTTSNKI